MKKHELFTEAKLRAVDAFRGYSSEDIRRICSGGLTWEGLLSLDIPSGDKVWAAAALVDYFKQRTWLMEELRYALTMIAVAGSSPILQKCAETLLDNLGLVEMEDIAKDILKQKIIKSDWEEMILDVASRSEIHLGRDLQDLVQAYGRMFLAGAVFELRSEMFSDWEEKKKILKERWIDFENKEYDRQLEFLKTY